MGKNREGPQAVVMKWEQQNGQSCAGLRNHSSQSPIYTSQVSKGAYYPILASLLKAMAKR